HVGSARDDQHVGRRLRGDVVEGDRPFVLVDAVRGDLAAQAPTHVLVIPRGPYVSWDDFSSRAPADEIAGFVRAVGTVARQLNLVEPGYRLLANTGAHGGQEVPHLHVHLFGGRPLGSMLAR
ncbi:MAG: HIT domain-containing protein, partial [Sphingomonas sp.]